jgi:hypothetical protein
MWLTLDGAGGRRLGYTGLDMARRTQTVYVATDPFFSSRGKVLYGFDRFLEESARAFMPCVWITGCTRAQLDEPRRRLGQSDPYIGENGCGVYLPEGYFHLKGSGTIRLGRYTCIPVAKPQPAAAEGLAELASDLGTSVVPLRLLSQRELSQNTGMPPREADRVRQRDFDELFFFAGASESEVQEFRDEAKRRQMVIQPVGAFWSIAYGASLAKCVRELGGLYDRALRAHALRVAVRLEPSGMEAEAEGEWPTAAFDKTLTIGERTTRKQASTNANKDNNESASPDEAESAADNQEEGSPTERPDRNRFYLYAPDVWSELRHAIEGSGHGRHGSKPAF